MNNYAQFVDKLEQSLNNVADSCSSHARAYDESPPEALSAAYSMLSNAWDAHAIIVNKDSRYRRAAALPYVDIEDGYKKYLQEVLRPANPTVFDKFLRSKLPKELRWI
jgi:hypothetical protein